MKASILLSGLTMMTIIVRAQEKPFLIKGAITGKTNDYIYLSYPTGAGDAYAADSTLIKNGHFSFTGKLSNPVQAYIILDKKSTEYGKYADIFIVPGNMELLIDYKKFPEGMVLKGSPVQQEMDVLTKARGPVMKRIKPLREAYEKASKAYREAMKAKKDSATLASLNKTADIAKDAMDPYYKQMEAIDLEFMNKHPQSLVTASLLRYRVSGMLWEEAEKRYNDLSDEIKNSGLGRTIKKQVDGLRKGSPGATAYVFASTEINGSKLSLGDYKGKYVLVDFWASWCGPCRKGNPHLLSLYAKYKNKGLEIIGISDDDSDPEAWRKAVAKDQIGVWKHILRGLKRAPNGAYDNSEDISDQFGIHSIPTKILIDPNGVIIGRYGEGGENDEAMDKKLADIFKDVAMVRFTGITDAVYNGEQVIIYNRSLNLHDSATVQNGRFVIEVPYKEPGNYMFASKTEMKKRNGYAPWGVMVAQPGDITLKMNMDSMYASTVSGSTENDLYNSYTSTGNAIYQKVIASLESKYGKDFIAKPDENDPKYKQLVADYEAMMQENKPGEEKRLEQFIDANPNSFAALYVLSTSSYDVDAAKLEALYNKLGTGYKSTSYGEKLAAKINAGKTIALGKMAPEFEQADTLGRVVKLSDFKGKYVLLDFWASWCKPCRAENPNVVAAFNKYNHKNFTVLGISLDQPNGKEKWLEAIHNDGLTWTHVSDLKFWDNSVAKQYGIESIPSNLLIDPSGKIVAENIRGGELEKKLAELLGSN
jgi:thiol-disulfide isomerase/thioredoxin